jgi:ProP effector
MKNPRGKPGARKENGASLSTPCQNELPAQRQVRRQNETVAAILQLLQEQWPQTFSIFESRRRPLKIGIHVDILYELDGAVTPIELANALRYYVANIGYLRAMRVGAPRIGLDGKPAGVVAADEAEHAREIRLQRATLKATGRKV